MNGRFPTRVILYLAGALIAFFVLVSVFPIVIVGAGERGVIFNNFSGVENRILGEG